jgi:hypothetical protein
MTPDEAKAVALDLAADILEVLRATAAELQKPPDVFDRLCEGYTPSGMENDRLARWLRERFGPALEHVKNSAAYYCTCGLTSAANPTGNHWCMSCSARAALKRLEQP